jgi:hypothetical protein
MLIRLSHVVVVVEAGRRCDGMVLLVEYQEVLLRAQQVSCDGTLEYFTYFQGTQDEFWQGIDQNRPTKFPRTQRFLTKAILTARMSRQRKTK